MAFRTIRQVDKSTHSNTRFVQVSVLRVPVAWLHLFCLFYVYIVYAYNPNLTIVSGAINYGAVSLGLLLSVFLNWFLFLKNCTKL